MKWHVGVAGKPIKHSLSPELHEEGMRLAGIKGSSKRFSIGQSDIKELKRLLKKEVDALSITAPLKKVSLPLCDALTPVAERLGAVNSLLVRDGVVHGGNFDGQGFIEAALHDFGTDFRDAHVAVVGSGGAAVSIVDALVNAGVSSVVVHGRTQENIDAIRSRYTNVYDSSLTYRPIDLVVNTVPTDARRLEFAVMQGISPDSTAIDITYDPLESDWLRVYRKLGCATSNGLGMLAFQAAAQMNWWWGSEINGADLLKVIQ